MVEILASKVVGGNVCYGADCGACGGSMARDDPPHFKYPDLIRLGAKGSLEDIGDKKLNPRSKFTQDTQTKLLLGFSSSTWRAMKIGQSLDKMVHTLILYGFRDGIWLFLRF